MKRLGTATLASILAACLSATAASATTVITPSTTGDDITSNGNCTLREAVQAANTDAAVDQCPAGSGTDVIQLGGSTYDLGVNGAKENGNQTGDLDVTAPLTIQGNGAVATTIDAHSIDRAIDVLPSASTTIQNLTLTNGAAPTAGTLFTGGAGEAGGAVRAQSALTLDGVSITHSHAGDGHTGTIVPGLDGNAGGDGGGVWTDHALTISGGTFDSDGAGSGSDGADGAPAASGSGNPGHPGGNGGFGGNGGAIDVVGGASLDVTGTTFQTLHAGFGGAGGDASAGASNSGGNGGNGGAGGNAGEGGFGGAITTAGPATLRNITSNLTVAGTGGNAGKGGAGGSGDIPAHNGQQGRNGDGGFGGDGGAVSGYFAIALTISGAKISRTFAGSGGAAPQDVGASTDGAAPGKGGGGGAIAGGEITVSHSEISDAHAGRGGTAATTFGATPPPGAAGGAGGGIDGSTVTVSDTTITGATGGQGGFGSNTVLAHPGDGGAGGGGGGVRATSTVTLTGVTLDHDSGGVGGGAGSSNAVNDTPGGAGGAGGGLLADHGGTLTNVTLDSDAGGAGGPGNDTGPGGPGGDGGGVHAAGALALMHVTVAESSPGAGGAAGAQSPGGQPGVAGGNFGPAQVSDSVVAGTTAPQCSGSANAGGNVSFPDNSCGGVNADPKLHALADNGGATKTMLLGAGSAALDTIAPGGADCTGTDQRGLARPQGPACDSGAVEAAIPALTPDPASVNFGAVGQGHAVAKTITVHTSFDALTPQALLPGPSGNGFTISSDGCSGTPVARLGTCTVEVTLNGDGAPGPRTGTLHVAHDVAGPPIDVPLTGTVIDTTPPVVSGLSLAHRTFAVAKRKPAPKGTTIRFNLSEPASVRFTITQKRPGRRMGKRCVAPTRKLRHAKRCARTLTLGSFTRSEPAGAASVRFSGRLGGRKLGPGSYTLTLSPTDLAGNRGVPKSIKFKIVKR